MMSQPEWCVFARELKRVFTQEGIPFTHLDDLKDEEGYIVDKRKAKRIWASLDSPSHFATLNPLELHRIIIKLGAKMEIQTRLQAAVLATAVEITLMNRITPDLALMASNQVFDLLHTALTTNTILATSIKGGQPVRTGAIPNVHTVAADQAFDMALHCIDDATLILHACYNTQSPTIRGGFAQDAIALYSRSIDLLAKAQHSDINTEDWAYWYDQAQYGLHIAQEYAKGITQ